MTKCSFQISTEFFKLTIKLFAVKLHAAALKDTSEQEKSTVNNPGYF